MKNFPLLLCIPFYLLLGCSDIKLGSGRQNDSVPAGVIEAEGSFEGRNGNEVSGTALIYLTPSGQRILRLQDLASPGEQRTDVVLVADGVTVLQTTLRAANGNQNYGVPVQDARNWNSVSLRLGSAPTDPEAGRALFIIRNP